MAVGILIEAYDSGEAPGGILNPAGMLVAEASGKPHVKRKRKASAYSKKYGKAFKKVSKRYKKKNGSWKKNGFKLAQKAAHKEAKK